MMIQSTRTQPIESQRLGAIAMMITGALLVLVIGFAPLAEVHNTTHDTRHATGFPCH